MQVVKKTGLVPVRSNETGDIFGVTPVRARELLAEKKVTLFEIPSEVEVIATDEPEPEKVDATSADFDIDIPDDWEGLHYLSKIKLAKEIVGGDLAVKEGQKTVDAAEEVIAAEYERRAVLKGT